MGKAKLKQVIKGRFFFLLPIALLPEYAHDFFRYVKHSGMVRGVRKKSLIGKIIQGYHVIEKGLTMPETRLGFGIDRVEVVADLCLLFQSKYGDEDMQVREAVSVVMEYMEFHSANRHELPTRLNEKIIALGKCFQDVSPSRQLNSNVEKYFGHVHDDFFEFSSSRRSVRNYSEQSIPIDLMKSVVDLSRNTPSSCNRQGSRVHVFTDIEQINRILSIQTGNRGFGHLVDKLIIVTGDLAYNYNVYERNQVYVDGGMMAMNLLYSLHYHKVVTCPLNCYLPYAKEQKLKRECGLSDSEVPVAMISCGFAPDSFKIAKSCRYDLGTILAVH
jgi:nitroreductase